MLPEKLKNTEKIGVIIAGGQSSRLAPLDKKALTLAQRSLVEIAKARFDSQGLEAVINCQPFIEKHDHKNWIFVPDGSLNKGPLAGISAALNWISSNRPNAKALVTTPVDTPFLADDLIKTLAAHQPSEHKICLLQSKQRIEPLLGVWPISAAAPLNEYLKTSPRLSVLSFAERYGFQTIDCSASAAQNFLNINTQRDYEQAKRITAQAEKGKS